MVKKRKIEDENKKDEEKATIIEEKIKDIKPEDNTESNQEVKEEKGRDSQKDIILLIKICVGLLVFISLCLVVISFYLVNEKIISGSSIKNIDANIQTINLENKSKVSIYNWDGVFKKSIQSDVLKQNETSISNLYTGGNVELNITASSQIKYSLTVGKDCILDQNRRILSSGNIKEGSIFVDKTAGDIAKPMLCLRLENPQFIESGSISAVEVNVEIFEYQ